MGGSDCSSPLMISGIHPADSTEDAFHTQSSGDSMARPVSFQRDDETVGLKGIIKTQEYIKIITRALYSLGFKKTATLPEEESGIPKTATLLEEESGIPLHSSSVTLFMQQVVDGKWDEGLTTLHNIGLLDEKMVTSAYFLIL